MIARKKSRGSSWRRWDMHVHTPASVLNNQFGDDWDLYVRELFTQAVAHDIAAIGITDYFLVDGYKKLKGEYLNCSERLSGLFSDELKRDPGFLSKVNQILVFPNVELRIDKFVVGKKDSPRLTVHVLFSDEVAVENIEADFLNALKFSFRGEPGKPNEVRSVNRSNLELLGARLRAEHPKFRERSDLFIGCMNATVNDDQVSAVLASMPGLFGNRFALVLAEEHTSEIAWDGADHQARKVLLQKCDAVFSSNESTIRYLNSLSFASEFGREKACFWGSDAHALQDLFKTQKNRHCWIKSDATFGGLRQVLNEPASRCYVGELPPALQALQHGRKPYIAKLSFKKKDGSSLAERWFDGCELVFNPGMVAIIGNKGSGKSALADTLALMGSSHVGKGFFSFLKPERFRKRHQSSKADRSQEFEATIEWHDGARVSRSLAEDVGANEVERVKYLPQGYLEKLCNENDDEAREAFRAELDRVIFSHVSTPNRLGKSSLRELVDYRTDGIKRTKSNLKRHIRDLNHQIVMLEQKTCASAIVNLDAGIGVKEDELRRFDATRPPAMLDPADDPRIKAENTQILDRIDKQQKDLAATCGEIDRCQRELSIIRIEIQKAGSIREKLRKFHEHYSALAPEVHEVMSELGIVPDGAIMAQVNFAEVDGFISRRKGDAASLESMLDPVNSDGLLQSKLKCEKKLSELRGSLEGPLRRYQTYRAELSDWEARREELIGSSDAPNTLRGLQRERELVRGAYVSKLRDLRGERRSAVGKLFGEIRGEMDVYKEYYQPALGFLGNGGDVLDAFTVSFDVVLDDSRFVDKFFNYVAQNVAGAFCGVAEGQKRLRELAPRDAFATEESTVDTIESILEVLGGREGAGAGSVLEKQLRKNSSVKDFYNFLFDLDYLAPTYALRVGGKDLHELSPGERGLLLLVFYLLIDRDNCPLIIDQPEENLDNQSVKTILVPCIRSAKDRRQLFVVTHNPNVAVVCDSEQIIVASIDKQLECAVAYEAGSIEDGVVNRMVVDVLEGTPPAFENRDRKYRTGGSLGT